MSVGPQQSKTTSSSYDSFSRSPSAYSGIIQPSASSASNAQLELFDPASEDAVSGHEASQRSSEEFGDRDCLRKRACRPVETHRLFITGFPATKYAKAYCACVTASPVESYYLSLLLTRTEVERVM